MLEFEIAALYYFVAGILNLPAYFDEVQRIWKSLVYFILLRTRKAGISQQTHTLRHLPYMRR